MAFAGGDSATAATVDDSADRPSGVRLMRMAAWFGG